MSEDFLRDLVDGEREALVPPRHGSSAREATWAAVAHSVGEGAAPAIDPSDVIGPASASGGGASWLKIIVALVLGGGTVAGVTAVVGGEQEPARAIAEPAPVAIRDAPVVEATPLVPAPAPAADTIAPPIPEPIAPEAIAPEPIASEPIVASKRESRPRAHAAPLPDASDEEEEPEPTPGSSALAEEARLLASARRALGRGAHADALARLAEHARRFPGGQLSEDRIALRARVHCDRGELEQGRRAAAELRRAFPRSSQLARVDRDCR